MLKTFAKNISNNYYWLLCFLFPCLSEGWLIALFGQGRDWNGWLGKIAFLHFLHFLHLISNNKCPNSLNKAGMRIYIRLASFGCYLILHRLNFFIAIFLFPIGIENTHFPPTCIDEGVDGGVGVAEPENENDPTFRKVHLHTI